MNDELHTGKYHTAMEYFERRFDRVSRQMGFKAESYEQYSIWKDSLRNKLINLFGINTCVSCGLNPQKVERIKSDGYFTEDILLETEPGVFMPVYVLIPENIERNERRPAVLALHGHCGGGRSAVAGKTGIPLVEQAIREFNYDYGVQLVREGFVVFCPDARGFGDRREIFTQGDSDDKILNSSCHFLSAMGLPLGQAVAGMMAWDNMRLIDYIQTRDDCDSGRIGCAGLSGGGQQTLWLAALYHRIQCAVISGYFYGSRSSLLKLSNNCMCNIVPHLWENVDMGDIGALIAPRALLIESGTEDPLNGEEGILNVNFQVEITRKAYELLSCPEKLYHHIFNGKHTWNGEKAIPWLKKWLMQN